MREPAAALLALVFFLLLHHIVGTSLPGGAKLTINLRAQAPCQVKVYWNHVPGHFEERRSLSSPPVPAGPPGEAVVMLRDTSLHSVRLDFDVPAVEILSLRLESHFAPSRRFSPAEMAALFGPLHPATSMECTGESLQLRSAAAPVSLVAREPLLRANGFLRHGVPLFFSFGLYLLLRRVHPTQMAALRDIEGKRPATGENIAALDGLRGLAAIMVVADHTLPLFKGTGAAGVLIFFALSGFLLARPFVANPAMVLSPSAMQGYFSRRLARVLPMYYFYLFITYVLTMRFDTALRHALFLEGAGHLWAIPQEMFFYLLLVPVLLLNHLVLRGRALAVISVLVLLMLLWNRFMDKTVLPMYGMDHRLLRSLAGVFLAGVILAWICHGTRLAAHLRRSVAGPEGLLVSVLGLALLLGGILFANGMLLHTHTVYAQQHFGWFGFGAAVLVACGAMTSRVSVLGRVLCWRPLRAIGVVSLSLYLLHPQVLHVLRDFGWHFFSLKVTHFRAFFSTLAVSYLLACFTYGVVERPCMARRPAEISAASPPGGSPPG